MNSQIIVVVTPDGELTMDAVGFKGADCERATAFLEKALGRIEAKRKKPEYYRCNTTHTAQQIQS